MTTPESVRNAIISEIEDSIQKGPVFHRDVGSKAEDSPSGQPAEADRDFAFSGFALESVLKRGLDARFALDDVLDTSTSRKSPKECISGLEEQLETFFVKSGLTSLLDEDDASWKDRVLAKKITNVDHLLLPLKDSHPILYQKFVKLPLISNKYKYKKKAKTARRARDSKECKDTPEAARGAKKRTESYDSRSECTFSATEMQLCHMIAKCIADNSLDGYLLALICLLQHDADHADSDAISSLGVGNLLAVLFEPTQAPGADGLQNPLHCLLRYIPKPSTPAKLNTDGFKYSTPEEKTQLSLASYLGHSDAASNVGSLLAEHGTETASMEDGEEDMTEEELLAQALAMSLGEPSGNASEPSNTDRAVSERPESPGSVFTQDERPAEESIAIPDLPSLHPLDAFAPFADAMFWKSVISEHAAHLPSLSLEVCVTALFVLLGASADFALDSEYSYSKTTPLQMYVPMLPASTTFELLCVLLELLLGRISESHITGKHTMKVQQFHVWCIAQCLKLLEANFSAVTTQEDLCGDACTTRDGDMFTLSHELLLHIATCMGSPVNPTAVSAGKIIDEVFGSVRDGKNGLKDIRHGVCICAIDALAAGFNCLIPSEKMRLCLLQSMIDNSHLNTAVFASKYSSSQFSNDGNDSYHPTTEYFSSLLLQKICVSYVQHRRKYAEPMAKSEKSDRSEESDDASSRQSPVSSDILSTLSEANRARVMEHLRALIPSGIDPNDRILERMFSAVVNAHDIPSSYSSQPTPTELSDDESISKTPTSLVNVTDDEALYNLELLLEQSLLCRLSSPLLMEKVNESVTTDINIKTCLFWGELQLLRSLQSKYESLLLGLEAGENSKTQSLALEFDSSSASGIVCDNDNTTIKQQRSNSWGTIKGSKVLTPYSGEYVWSIRVNKCEKGHVFLGIATGDAKSDVYLGRDKHGWGLLGTKSLWHGRSKVNSSYGESFHDGMIIHVKYDSNRGRLSYSTDKAQWGIAFDDIPAVNMYPAVSFYHNGDSVTAITPSGDDDAVSVSASDESDRSPSPVIRFIRYASHIFELVEQILHEINACTNDDFAKRNMILLHPYISMLLPSLVATIVTCSCNARVGCMLSVHLLPQLTVIIKRFAQLCESDEANVNKVIDQSVHGFIGNISGDWKISSAAAGGAIPAQEYTIALSLTDSIVGEMRPLYRPVTITGQGEGRIPAVTVVGHVFGTRIHFEETWAMGGTCIVDGRLTLDGNEFSGCYKDVKSGIVGTLKARKLNRLSGFQTQNYLTKAAMLAAMACGKLVSFLIIGMPATAANRVDELDVMNVTKDATDDPTLFEEQKDEVDEETGTATLTEGASDTNADSLLRHWIKSDLLSGGLIEDRSFCEGITDQLRSYCILDDPLFKPHETTALLKEWWLEQVMPELCHLSSSKEQKSAEDPDAELISRNMSLDENSFFLQVQSSTGQGKRLDDYLAQHVGISMLFKIGGEAMQVARRKVIAALLHHVGCVKLCDVEVNALNNREKTNTDKPNEILMEVWRAGQRVIEHNIRKKQSLGTSYGFLSHELCKQAEFLMTIQPNATSKEISAHIDLMSQTLVSPRRDSTIADTMRTMASKIIQSVVEFFQSGVVGEQLSLLRSAMFNASLRTVSRTAGLKAIGIIFGKPSTLFPNLVERLPPLTNITLQPVVIEYLQPALHGIPDISVRVSLFDTAGPTHLSGEWNKVVAEACGKGHYTDNLHGSTASLLQKLRDSFENVYELVTQLLQRCTWALDREGQLVSLGAWDIRIQPDEHTFLNKIFIFRVLQTVLDDVRGAIASLSRSDICEEKQYYEMTTNSLRRLAQLALKIMHSLASQVAFTKDDSTVSASLQMQRNPSGPETLTNSLFDMLYSELYTCMKKLISSSQLTDVVDMGEAKVHKYDDLEGESYAYRVLRLLFSISNSSACQKHLSSPKWLSLLFAGVGCGDSAVQRRLLRLLRRLLTGANPENIQVYLTGIHCKRDDILFTDSAPDDEDVIGLIESKDDKLVDIYGYRNCVDKVTNAVEIVLFFMEAAAMNISPCEELGDVSEIMTASLHSFDAVDTLVAESISLLRMLHDVPVWRPIIYCALKAPLHAIARGTDSDQWNNLLRLRMIAATVGVMGGYIDRMRIGGTVTLKPFSLVGMSESFALRLAAAAHSCGLLVSKSAANNSTELVLMERARKPVRSKDGSIEGYAVHYAMSLSGAVPMRTVKLTADDVIPSADIPPSPEFFDNTLVSDFLYILEHHCLPLISTPNTIVEDGSAKSLEETKSNDDNDDNGQEEEDEVEEEEVEEDGQDGDDIDDDAMGVSSKECDSLQYYVSTATFRMLATAMQCDNNVAAITSRSPELLSKLLNISVQEVSVGSLAEIEVIEERWASVWETYSSLDYSADSKNIEKSRPSNSNSNPLSARLQQMENSILRASRETSSGQSGFIASMLAAPSPADAQRAREQMMEMGFPREWCDVALRRCRYNVEMAINLCFEHGSEMNMIVAEDQAMQATAQSSTASRSSNRAASVLGGLARSRGVRSSDSQNDESRRTQLMDMGFPASWCTRALELNRNNIDAALGWILTHTDELCSDEKNVDKESEEDRDEKVNFHPNPLSVISGTATIRDDLTCIGSSGGGFPSVGCRGFHVTAGKWYFEATLLTGGCMQVGWVDIAYTGNSEIGEGVGDDMHSWAYDGWRRLLWHEISSEWGARWSTGQVVGCALDLDNRTMSFYLNGYGEEVGMGLAFKDFTFCGGLYPCISYNRSEKMSLNFGHTPFKFGPPPGYAPYLEHVRSVCDSNIHLMKELSLKYLPEVLGTTNLFEDALEEQRGEGNFLSHLRYFQPDESRGSLDRSSVTIHSSLQKRLPTNRSGLVEELERLSKDLCRLYARWMILRIISSQNRISSNPRFFAEFLSFSEEGSSTSNADQLMLLVRMCSLHTQRTKVYLQTMSILPSGSPPPNLGSIFLTGGAPMLAAMHKPIRQLLLQRRDSNDRVLLNCLLQQLRHEAMLSTRRDFIADWKYNSGFSPYLIKNSDMVSSLPYAVWLSLLLQEQFIKELDGHNDFMNNWLTDMITSWMYLIKSPVIAVKLTGVRLLSCIFQEMYFGDVALVSIAQPYFSIFSSIIPMSRLQSLALRRIDYERGSHPICSEYVQSLVEFVVAYQAAIVNMGADVPRIEPNGQYLIPVSSAESDESISDFNWDAIAGSLLEDDGWEVWTGCVQQLSSTFSVTESTSVIPVRGRQEQAPELLPGCMVARPITAPQRAQEKKDDDSSPSRAEVKRPALFSLLHGESRPAEEKSSRRDEDMEIGTVTEVVAWDASSEPGTARMVKWQSGAIEKVRWGNGTYDVVHVIVDSQNKITTKYPPPPTIEKRAQRLGFSTDMTFGIIFRLRTQPRSADDNEYIQGRFDGLMEWPDFCAIVYVTGIMYSDGHWTVVEEKLLSGSDDADWTCRFGTPKWRPGVTYDLSLQKYSSLQSAQNADDGKYFLGQYSYPVTCFKGQHIHVSGNIKIQQTRLFTFDQNYRANSINLSNDRIAAACNGGEGKCCVYATVGFSSGVHYWEFKIEQCDIGNIFVGVSEKPTGTSNVNPPRLAKWHGYGFVNLRTSYKQTVTGGGERVYGDLFQTGDTVGVMLDMNRGRLSFFLDGIKYGEHTLADLGEAFDGLSSSNYKRLQRKTYFPVVGFRRAGDRVTITPRWLSTTGTCASNDLSIVSRAWGLLTTWGIERTSSRPLANDLWAYREAWRDYIRWKSNRFLRVRTRCKAPSLLVGVDTSPRACVDASIRLGLARALFSGDRIVFHKSTGRLLEAKEEAIILGAYRGVLWYRLDSQQGESANLEGSTLAWCLAPHDVEDMKLLRRGRMEALLSAAVVDMPLARVPCYDGGLVRIIYEGGAVMRSGLEIDTSEVIATIDTNTVVYAIERRVSSSNIARYRVWHKGSFGWISERIRGGTEEFMIARVTSEPACVVEDAFQEVLRASSECDFRVEWTTVASHVEALQRWESDIMAISGCESYFQPGGLLHDNSVVVNDISFDDFVELCSTYDGRSNWSVEADMQLTEVISRVAAQTGTSPFNLSCKQVLDGVKCLEDANALRHIDSHRITARAALIRVTNIVIGYALPYIETVLPEERWKNDCYGNAAGEIDVVTSKCASNNQRLLRTLSSDTTDDCDMTWAPPCAARRLRSLRRVLFAQTKRQFWENILEATTTPTPLHQDEYEDPREIKTIRINRVKATISRLTEISNSNDRLRQSVFGQLHREMRGWSASAFRRSYVSKGHGGQRRAFKVKFMGEGVNDYGGPYRAVFEQVVDELQCDAFVSAGRRASERCLLPLLIPCPNRIAAVGSNQDKFLINSSPTSPLTQELMQYFGKLAGTAVRHNLNMALDLSSLCWRPLVRLPLSRAHLDTVDTLAVNNLVEIEKLAVELEQSNLYDDSYAPEEWRDLSFTVYLGDSTKVSLIPGGDEIPVSLGNWREFIRLVEKFRLKESSALYRAFRDGLSAVLPIELFSLFTATEFEQLVSGSSTVDVNLLRQCTEYEELDPESDLVKNFWSVLESLSPDDRTLFLRFVWARSRMPASMQDLPMNFKLQAAQGDAKAKPDLYLPHAQTCFFSLSLPPYSSKDILREKLLYAIHNSPNMDADVRLHNAEGWADA